MMRSQWLRQARASVLVLLATLLGPAAVAEAQRDGWIAAGGGIVTRASREPGVGDSVGPSFLIRLGRGGSGWGMRYGFDWFSTDLDRPIGGEAQSFGRLRVRPVLAGYGYSVQRGPAQVSFNIKGGYAFTSFHLRPSYSSAYGSAFSTSAIRASAANTFVVKPEISLWVDVSRKVGLNISTGYMVARPHVTLSSAAGSERRRVDADMFVFQVGAAYNIF